MGSLLLIAALSGGAVVSIFLSYRSYNNHDQRGGELAANISKILLLLAVFTAIIYFLQ